jgi:hypothetical protein
VPYDYSRRSRAAGIYELWDGALRLNLDSALRLNVDSALRLNLAGTGKAAVKTDEGTRYQNRVLPQHTDPIPCN